MKNLPERPFLDSESPVAPFFMLALEVEAMNAVSDAMRLAKQGDWSRFERVLEGLSDSQLSRFIEVYSA